MLIRLEEVSSTNSYLKENRNMLPDGAAVTALKQTAGRGRRGREWLSDEGMLPLSVLLKAPQFAAEITLCAAVAVCEVLDSHYGGRYNFGIKWPNDIVLNGRKLCGILCESVYFGDSCEVICGIGINLSQSEEYFRQAELPYGASLEMLTGSAPERNALAETIAERVIKLSKSGFSDIYDSYRRRCITLGRDVKLIINGSEQTARAVDIAPNGYLICSNENGELSVNSGEVSVRGLYGYV